MYLDWNILEEPEEVIEEICDGITLVDRDSQLRLISSLIYNLDFTYEEIERTIREMDEEVYEY